MLTAGQTRFFFAVGVALAMSVVAVLAVAIDETRSAVAPPVSECPPVHPAAIP
jgi:hypothetical protein